MLFYDNQSSCLYVPNTFEFPYDEEYPFVVVNSSGEPVARFVGPLGAEMFLAQCLQRWGRIVDTSPRRGKHE